MRRRYAIFTSYQCACSCFDSGLECTDVCGCCNCKNKRQEKSNALESEKANSTSAKLDDTALPSDFDEDDSESDSDSDIE